MFVDTFLITHEISVLCMWRYFYFSILKICACLIASWVPLIFYLDLFVNESTSCLINSGSDGEHPEETWWRHFWQGAGLLSSIPAKFNWFILFCTLIATSFLSCVRCSGATALSYPLGLGLEGYGKAFSCIFSWWVIDNKRGVRTVYSWFIWEICQTAVVSIFRDIFLAPITLDHYHFQSEYDKQHTLLGGNAGIFLNCLPEGAAFPYYEKFQKSTGLRHIRKTWKNNHFWLLSGK